MTGRPSLVLGTATLWRREMVRFFRQQSRWIGSLLTPLLFWLLFSAGYSALFASNTTLGASSFAYFLPGTIALILLFTSIFANISVIEDRHEGFLQGVLVAPLPRSGIVLGKVLGGASIAMLQGVLFIILGAVFGVAGGKLHVGLVLFTIALLSLGITAFGFSFAWRLDSVQGFHGVMNLLLMPMWLLSGALFPLSGAPQALKAVMLANPVTYGLALLQVGLGATASDLPSVPLSLLVLGTFTAASFAAAAWIASRVR